MINERKIKIYCCEDISLIENYENAKSSKEIYNIHHKKEIDESLSAKQLIEKGLYYHRPANELIFLTKSEHSMLHGYHRKHTEKSKRKMSEDRKGHKVTEETRRKLSQAIKRVWASRTTD